MHYRFHNVIVPVISLSKEVAFLYNFIWGIKPRKRGLGREKIRFVRILETELEFGASLLLLMSPLMAFYCVNNFVIVNLLELMDRINGEIFPLP